jgi:hypothetical protein
MSISQCINGRDLINLWIAYDNERRHEYDIVKRHSITLYEEYVNAITVIYKDVFFVLPLCNFQIMDAVGSWLHSNLARLDENAYILIIDALGECFPLPDKRA